MRIGVDATCWANRRGYGRFARELTAALLDVASDHHFVAIGDRQAFESFAPRPPHLELRAVDLDESPVEAASATGSRSLRDMLRLTRAVRAARVDVFFSPSVYTYFPLTPGQRAVVTIHDAIAERFPELTLPSRRARLFWRLKVGLALHQARLILTVSDYAAREIVRELRVAPSRLRVAGEAPAAAYTPSETGDIARVTEQHELSGRPYFVYVGGFNPHKRVDAVIQAHAAVVRAARDQAPILVLVGRVSGDVFHGEVERLRALVDQEGTSELVRWTGFVPDEELRHLHSGALAVVLASESEGFGLPAVEGAACGAPMIVTRESPLPELFPRGALVIEPGNVGSIATAMRTLLHAPASRSALGAAALSEARALSWTAAATSTLAALREAAA